MKRAFFWLLLVVSLAACADPNTNTPPLITQFDADSDALTVTFRWQLIEPDGDALTCQLDVDGDGVFEYTIRDCASNRQQQHTYIAPGQYDVLLVVDDGRGESSLRQQTLNLSALMPGNTPPDIDDFRAIPAVGESPFATTFTWLVFDADGDALRCVLEPADGSEPYVFEDCNAVSSQPHVYHDAGVFAARLTVDDGGGGITQRETRSQVSGGARVTVQGRLQFGLADVLGTAWTARVPAALAHSDPLISALQRQAHPLSQLIARDSQGRIIAETPVRGDGSFRMQVAAEAVTLQVALLTDTDTINAVDRVDESEASELQTSELQTNELQTNAPDAVTTANNLVCTWYLANTAGERWLEPTLLDDSSEGASANSLDITLGTFQLGQTAYLSSPSDTATQALTARDPDPMPTTLRVSASDPCPSYDVRGQLKIHADALPPDGFANVIYALADTVDGWVAVAAAPVDMPEDTFTLTVPRGMSVRLLLTRAGTSSHNFLPLWQLAPALSVNSDTDLGELTLALHYRQGQLRAEEASPQDVFIISGSDVISGSDMSSSDVSRNEDDWVGLTLARSEAGEWHTWLPEGSLPGRSSAYLLTDDLTTDASPLATWSEERNTTAVRVLDIDDIDATNTTIASTIASASTTSSTLPAATSRSVPRNRPVVDIRLPERYKRGTTIDLDASASFDPGGLPLRYTWRLLERPEGSRSRLTADQTAQMRFTPDVAGAYRLELLVSNGERVTIDTVTLEVRDNRPPEVTLEAAAEVSLGDVLELRALITDSDDDRVGMRWQLEQAPTGSRLVVAPEMRRVDVQFASQTQSLTLTPDRAGEYVVTVIVTDGDVETRSSQRIRVFDDFVVTHAGDSGRGSLRWALEAANATAQADTIRLEPLTDAIVLNQPLPVIQHDLTIQTNSIPADSSANSSSAKPVTVQASGNDMRLLEVAPGVSLSMIGVQLTGGRAGTTLQQGGALYVHEGAHVSLTDCLLSDNGAQAEGGAVANFGRIELYNCTLEGNLAARGGAIYASTGSHTQLTDSVLVANSAARAGGAVYQTGTLEATGVRWQANGTSGGGGALWSGGVLALNNNYFADNRAGTGGGGIWQQSGRIDIANSQLRANLTTNGRGGGLHLRNGARAVLHDNQWLANRSDNDNGGALFISEGSHADVAGSTFYDNYAGQFAGAIDNFGRLQLHSSTLRANRADKAAALSNGTGARATIDSCLFVANHATQFAGAIANFAALDMVNSTLSDNQATFGAALLSGNNATHTRISHSTIVANRAAQGGAGILHGQGDTTLAHSIVLGNVSEALTGDCVHTENSPSQVVSLGYNLLGRGGGCTAADTDLTLPARALFEEVLQPLADNGGSTHSHALLPQSPALDAGTQTDDYPPFDQRGEGFVRLSGLALDIGAFEADSQTAASP